MSPKLSEGNVDHDLRGATLIDGTGADPRRVDAAIRVGRIDAVSDRGREEGCLLDLDGLTCDPVLLMRIATSVWW